MCRACSRGDGVLIVKAEPCETVYHFAARMVRIAAETFVTVLGEFNQHTFEARVGMTRDDVMAEWDRAQRASYFGTATSK